MRTLPLSESSRGDVVASIAQFLSPRNPFQVLIVSYETFRIHAERFRCARASPVPSINHSITQSINQSQ